MTYRCLTKKELLPLKKEFIQYLASNGMAGEDWSQLQEGSPKEARVWVEQFSQLVWEKSLPKVRCLEQKTPRSWTCIQVQKTQLRMTRLELRSNASLSFDQDHVLSQLQESGAELLQKGEMKLITGNKKVRGTVDQEVYNLLEQGYNGCSEAIYLRLTKLAKPAS